MEARAGVPRAKQGITQMSREAGCPGPPARLPIRGATRKCTASGRRGTRWLCPRQLPCPAPASACSGALPPRGCSRMGGCMTRWWKCSARPRCAVRLTAWRTERPEVASRRVTTSPRPGASRISRNRSFFARALARKSRCWRTSSPGCRPRRPARPRHAAPKLKRHRPGTCARPRAGCPAATCWRNVPM